MHPLWRFAHGRLNKLPFLDVGLDEVFGIWIAMKDFIQNLPKIELHLHIEGTLEPELLLKLARRNGVSVPFKSKSEVRDAYHFSGFLTVAHAGE
ncbi:MAG: hypothetical protein P8J17_01700 [Halioglobus sp.]|nr:hypothetical protein [Halioglobus sp.]